ncbi:uncharacterized protein K452DRAFT_352814 [Aplosporella prunicola CBS 121167]|uniref:Uncharacterized protein n=1 Tax=Aplosporella prunicola CBS 121167 TaxID=1176127 RepID=A0A6A6B6B1_9PEZI|nr:uncharacterized protein K452DRAFT_352814 [Aplosporella prunicola CBS 121167]KAF2139178.1 hypothetical protein K452DRAFT_352814 [Aplosporella prunicola CBS 121167]
MLRTLLRRKPSPLRISLKGPCETKRSLLTKAFASGPTQPPLLEQTVDKHFASIVSQHGDRPAVISRHQRTTLSYDALDRKSNSLARGMQSIGVKKGDRIAVCLGDNIEYTTLIYALFKLGAILVPINPAFNATQVVSALNHLAVSHIVIGTETRRPRKEPRSNVPLLKHLIADLNGSAGQVHSELVPSLQSVVLVDNSDGRVDVQNLGLTPWYAVQDGGSGAERPLPEQGLDPNDIVNIQFTSGTTSSPKAACLINKAILNNGRSIGDRMLLTSKDVVCCPPPLFHCFGSVLGYMATATHGSAFVLPSECFDAEASLRAVQEYACTALYGVPTMFLAELELLAAGVVPNTGFSQLRTGIAAGSSVPAEVMKKLHKVLNLTELTICYGMTETSPVSAMTTTDDPIKKRVETVGRLMPHVTAKVVNPADWTQVLNVGERGELTVSGYLTMKGYWGDEERTAEVLVPDEEGMLWMHTGDEASMDEEGYVTITGRIKDLIIKGGENIHPSEVENCLLAHDAVAEVSVVGVPDERYGEVVSAFIVVHSKMQMTAKETRDFVGQNLSHHLVPKYVFWVDSIPKTANGKTQKFKLKETAIQMLKDGKGIE